MAFGIVKHSKKKGKTSVKQMNIRYRKKGRKSHIFFQNRFFLFFCRKESMRLCFCYYFYYILIAICVLSSEMKKRFLIK